MRRSKTIYILLGVLAVLCIGAFAVSKIETHKENIRNSGEVFLSIDPSAVTALSWQVGDSDYSFTKTDGWTYDSDAAFPVDENKINTLLETFRDFSAAFVIDDADDLSQYGLNDPEGIITVTTASQSYTIQLGDYSTMDSQRYVSIGDGKVYLVSYDPMDDFSTDLSGLILNDTIPYFETISAVSFTGEESYSLTYQEDSANTYCADDVYFVGTKPLDTGAVDGYLSYLSYLSLSDFVTYSATVEDLDTYYLQDPALSATVNYSSTTADGTVEEGSFSFSIGCDAEALAEAEESGDTSDIAAYFRVGDSPIIYQISSYDYDALMSYTYNDLRHDDIISAGMDTVYQMEITLEGKTYTLTRDEEAEAKSDEEVAVWKYGDETAVFSDLSNALSGLTADGFTDSAQPGKQEIALTLYLHNDNFPEVSVILYRYDGTDCLAKVDGQTVAFVPRSQVVDLIEAVNGIVLNADN